MNFPEYQAEAKKVRKCRCPDDTVVYLAIGVSTEANELLEIVKKLMRKPSVGIAAFEDSLPAISEEIGDVLWNLSALCNRLGLDLNEIAEANLIKVRKRLAEGRYGECA